MNTEELDIYNHNLKKCTTQNIYDSFNSLMLSNDISLIGKLLHRFQFYEKIKHLPGDIVEVGVFKGSGMASWLKFLEIFETNSNRKVIGFDLFNPTSDIIDTYKNGNKLKTVLNRIDHSQLSYDSVDKNLHIINNSNSKYILIKGDVCETTKEFVNNNKGFRIALIYMDLDLSEPTYTTLCNLWNNLLPGGIIVFDEYEYHKFDECDGVDLFLKEFKINYDIVSTHFMSPTAYMIKKQNF